MQLYRKRNYKRKWETYLNEYMDKNTGLISRAVQEQIEKGKWGMPEEVKKLRLGRGRHLVQ